LNFSFSFSLSASVRIGGTGRKALEYYIIFIQTVFRQTLCRRALFPRRTTHVPSAPLPWRCQGPPGPPSGTPQGSPTGPPRAPKGSAGAPPGGSQDHQGGRQGTAWGAGGRGRSPLDIYLIYVFLLYDDLAMTLDRELHSHHCL